MTEPYYANMTYLSSIVPPLQDMGSIEEAPVPQLALATQFKVHKKDQSGLATKESSGHTIVGGLFEATNGLISPPGRRCCCAYGARSIYMQVFMAPAGRRRRWRQETSEFRVDD